MPQQLQHNSTGSFTHKTTQLEYQNIISVFLSEILNIMSATDLGMHSTWGKVREWVKNIHSIIRDYFQLAKGISEPLHMTHIQLCHLISRPHGHCLYCSLLCQLNCVEHFEPFKSQSRIYCDLRQGYYANFLHFMIFPFFQIIKTLVIYNGISLSYFTGVTITQLRWHLKNINMN